MKIHLLINHNDYKDTSFYCETINISLLKTSTGIGSIGSINFMQLMKCFYGEI